MNRHVKEIHNKKKSHICDLCEESFVRKFSMNRHVKEVYNKKKLHVYDLCEKSFAREFDMNRHIKVCNKNFINKIDEFQYNDHLLIILKTSSS